jgi:hypothetical protein
MRTRLTTGLWIGLLLTPAVLLAQADVNGRITGRVTNNDGQPVAGALVEVTCSALAIDRKATTGANGAHRHRADDSARRQARTR